MGVEVHANIIDNLLHYGEPARTFLTRGLREEGTDLGLILLFGLGLGYCCHRLRPLYATLLTLGTLTAFAALAPGNGLLLRETLKVRPDQTC